MQLLPQQESLFTASDSAVSILSFTSSICPIPSLIPCLLLRLFFFRELFFDLDVLFYYLDDPTSPEILLLFTPDAELILADTAPEPCAWPTPLPISY